jgi:3-phosphoshikimate 1-carboxyvinyltransferase
MKVRVSPPPGGLHGTATVPGDKSIAHRALLFGALADGTTTVSGFPGGADVLATLGAVRALGAEVEHDGEEVRVRGHGLRGSSRAHIDCANSGTTMRLTVGLVAPGERTVTLDGDASLRRRPMERVAEPLRAMGAQVETTAGRPPVTVHGGPLAGVDLRLPVASAQVKSALLLAGLGASGRTRVHEPVASRDHTERLLAYLGAEVRRGANAGVPWAEVVGGQRLAGRPVSLPGDFSSAAFLLVAALVVPDSDVRVNDVGVNPTRTGLLPILARMGGAVEVHAANEQAGEPRATLAVRSAVLRGVDVLPAEAPATIDELPIVAVAAALADGETTIAGAGELRVKESDRIAGMEQLRRLGVAVRATEDGLVIRGSAGRRLSGGSVDAGGDHRIAMAFAVAGLAAEGGVEIAGAECVDVSFPGFFACLAALGARVERA